MAALRTLTTTVLEPPLLSSLSLISFKKWTTDLLPNYYRLAKADKLPVEELLELPVLETICTLLGITIAAFTALADDDAKFAQLIRVICPYSDPSDCLTALRRVVMPSGGDLLDAWISYRKEFEFYTSLSAAEPLPGITAFAPQAKDIVRIFVDNLRPKLATKVRAHISICRCGYAFSSIRLEVPQCS